jgi:hypothetical protein
VVSTCGKRRGDLGHHRTGLGGVQDEADGLRHRSDRVSRGQKLGEAAVPGSQAFAHRPDGGAAGLGQGLCHEVELGLDSAGDIGGFRATAGMDIARGQRAAIGEGQGHVRPAARREAAGMAGVLRDGDAVHHGGDIRIGQARAGDLIGADMALGDPGGEREAQGILRLRRGGGQAGKSAAASAKVLTSTRSRYRCVEAMSVHQPPVASSAAWAQRQIG